MCCESPNNSGAEQLAPLEGVRVPVVKAPIIQGLNNQCPLPKHRRQL